MQYGRLVSLCTLRDTKYRVAVTKVMGHNLDAIVCDSAETARLAIGHLKTHRHLPETFLPVNDLYDVPSIDNVNRYEHHIYATD